MPDQSEDIIQNLIRVIEERVGAGPGIRGIAGGAAEYEQDIKRIVSEMEDAKRMMSQTAAAVVEEIMKVANTLFRDLDLSTAAGLDAVASRIQDALVNFDSMGRSIRRLGQEGGAVRYALEQSAKAMKTFERGMKDVMGDLAEKGVGRAMRSSKQYERVEADRVRGMVRAMEMQRQLKGIETSRVKLLDDSIAILSEEAEQLEATAAAKERQKAFAPIAEIGRAAGIPGVEKIGKIVGAAGMAAMALAGLGIAVEAFRKYVIGADKMTTQWRGGITRASVAMNEYSDQTDFTRRAIQQAALNLGEYGLSVDETRETIGRLITYGMDPMRKYTADVSGKWAMMGDTVYKKTEIAGHEARKMTLQLGLLTAGMGVSNEQISETSRLFGRDFYRSFDDVFRNMVRMKDVAKDLNITNEERIKIQMEMLETAQDYNVGLGEVTDSFNKAAEGGKGVTRSLREFREVTLGVQRAGAPTAAFAGMALGMAGDPFEAMAMIRAGGKEVTRDFMDVMAKRMGFGGMEEVAVTGLPKEPGKWSEEQRKQAGRATRFVTMFETAFPDLGISVETMRSMVGLTRKGEDIQGNQLQVSKDQLDKLVNVADHTGDSRGKLTEILSVVSGGMDILKSLLMRRTEGAEATIPGQ